MMYWTSAHSLKLLHRFLDHQQCPLLVEPKMNDGSNIPRVSSKQKILYWEWEFYRHLVRTLHHAGMTKPITDHNGDTILHNDRLNDLLYLYMVSRYLLEYELRDVPATYDADSYTPLDTDCNKSYLSASRFVKFQKIPSSLRGHVIGKD